MSGQKYYDENNNQQPHETNPSMEELKILEGTSHEASVLIKKYQARVRQLRAEIEARREENELISQENLSQNEQLRALNAELDKKVKDRTGALEASKKKLEEQNNELQQINESKEAMMHMIVHDMKNPLTAVMGALIILEKLKTEPSETLRELIKDAHIQSMKLRTMMDDILTISKMKSNEFKVECVDVDLITLVQQSVLLMTMVKGNKNLSIFFQPEYTE